MEKMKTAFYLTGGTALSRCYLHHRYSDDLDFFVNDHPGFKSETSQAISIFKSISKWEIEIGTVSDSFVRLVIKEKEITLKVDFVNDIKFHRGEFQTFDIYRKVDNLDNILSNKICALSRMDAKDIIDILFIAKNHRFDWEKIFKDAQEKDLWVEPLTICKILNEFPVILMENIKWIGEVDTNQLTHPLKILTEDVFYGRPNSLVTAGIY